MEKTTPHSTKSGLLNRIALIVGSGLIFLFFSEFFFMNEGPTLGVVGLYTNPGEIPAFVLTFGLVYSLFAAWFLVPVQWFNVRTVWGVFLAAALFGWAVEGIVIPYIYLDLPISLLWPSMSWHVFVDVFLGWWLVRRVLHRNAYAQTISLAFALGLFWGLWATWLAETEVGLLSATSFASFAFLTSTCWIAGNIIIDRGGGGEFRPSRVEFWGLFLLSIAMWAATTWSLFPVNLLFPAIVLGVGWLLSRSAASEPRASIITTFSGRIQWQNHLMLLLTPAVASITYPLYVRSGVLIESWIVALPLIAAGVIMLGASLVKSFWKQGAHAAGA